VRFWEFVIPKTHNDLFFSLPNYSSNQAISLISWLIAVARQLDC
jgi:hypothetical protein